MVYTSSTLSLATLEILVHVEDSSIFQRCYRAIPVSFDLSPVHKLEAAALPSGWNTPEITAGTQMLGDDWIKREESVLLEVPSAVIPSESNFLINPDHPDFAEIVIGEAFEFEPDPRLGPGTP